jgi:hypothetical protein
MSMKALVGLNTQYYTTRGNADKHDTVSSDTHSAPASCYPSYIYFSIEPFCCSSTTEAADSCIPVEVR